MTGVRLLQEVPEDRCLRIAVPEWMGSRVEVIIKKTDGGEPRSPEATDCVQLQQGGGFLKGVLQSAHEDIWNEL
ncbi:MAG TPA: hypothetical protein DCZ75_14435 [Geobacter sp.]|nr:hypothetical protein [Geobacter sp.]